ncbi:hypothetical protein HDU96_001872 [Phlyctochytrium bullatum]|nr:hypothetical protein HDU96_001872 [Phlyctochytrium bullatum]
MQPKEERNPTARLLLLVGIVILIGASLLQFVARHVIPAHYTSLVSVSNSSADSSKLPVTDRLSMTFEECEANFPRLFDDIFRVRDFYQAKGGIDEELIGRAVESGYTHARVVIHNNKVYVKEARYSINSRTNAVLSSLHDAVITSIETLPNVEFVFHTGDALGNGAPDWAPIWTLCRTAEQPQLWLLPDYGFYSWPEPGMTSYSEVRRTTLKHELKMKTGNVSKIPKLFWRGALFGRPIRQDLLESTRNQSWADVDEIVWKDLSNAHSADSTKKDDYRTAAEHCDYMYLMHAEGHSYSGRLKYLLLCRSLVLMHQLTFIQHFHHLLDGNPKSPNQNVIIVPTPFKENLGKVMETLLELKGSEWEKRVLDNAWNELREKYLSPAAIACYWRRMIKEYSTVMNYKPSLRMPRNDSIGAAGTGLAAPYEGAVSPICIKRKGKALANSASCLITFQVEHGFHRLSATAIECRVSWRIISSELRNCGIPEWFQIPE